MVFLENYFGYFSAYVYTEAGLKFEVCHPLAGVDRRNLNAVKAALLAAGYELPNRKKQ